MPFSPVNFAGSVSMESKKESSTGPTIEYEYDDDENEPKLRHNAYGCVYQAAGMTLSMGVGRPEEHIPPREE